jgi:hypothetical protein
MFSGIAPAGSRLNYLTGLRQMRQKFAGVK